MYKNIFLLLIGVVVLASCSSDASDTSSEQKEEPVTVHAIDEARLSLPVAYEKINAVQDLKKMLETKGGKITSADPGFLNFLTREIGLGRYLYFDGKSHENLNFVYVDRTGPRFPFTEDVISKYIDMYEAQTKARFPEGSYSNEKLSHKIQTVWENEMLVVRHRHQLGKLEWFTTQYLIKMKSTKRTFLIFEYDYNGGKTNLERYITTIY